MQNNILRILALGDVVGSAAVETLRCNIRKIKQSECADVVLVNAENCSDSNGTDIRGAESLLESGADVLTGGNHTIKLHELYNTLDENKFVLRPANLPPLCPGHGFVILQAKNALRLLVISMLGQTFMPPCDNPFLVADRILKENQGNFDIAVCDFHAEATSEKAAFAEYFDGRIHVVFGTHTHVQTADERYFPNGTGFITDIGMCGVEQSVLGVKSSAVIKQFVTSIHDRFERADGLVTIHGALFDVNVDTKSVVALKRIRI
ncbi:MAG: TIGR00282 family metallophosphoesterase [Clostridia bacterium]